MKIVIPGYDVPLVGQNGVLNPVWYEKLQALASKVNDLEARGVLDMPDVDNSTPITNGQVLVYDSTAEKLKPGSN